MINLNLQIRVLYDKKIIRKFCKPWNINLKLRSNYGFEAEPAPYDTSFGGKIIKRKMQILKLSKSLHQ